MSRRISKRQIRDTKDTLYHNNVIGRMINSIMKDGKKTVAEKIVYKTIDLYAAKYAISKEESISRIEDAIFKVRPSLELKSKRVGGATLSIPVEVRPRKATSLAIRWIQDAFLARNEKTAYFRLLGEIIDIQENKGAAILKRDNIHKMAESNKVYSHYR